MRNPLVWGYLSWIEWLMWGDVGFVWKAKTWVKEVSLDERWEFDGTTRVEETTYMIFGWEVYGKVSIGQVCWGFKLGVPNINWSEEMDCIGDDSDECLGEPTSLESKLWMTFTK